MLLYKYTSKRALLQQFNSQCSINNDEGCGVIIQNKGKATLNDNDIHSNAAPGVNVSDEGSEGQPH